mmetsp:Transcript_30249/g.58139  ORF Transcript_30249/g.58139 Transcript_30249/m.58139 type:complete len:1012 (+) Transcript_30249:229-3264(+)
MIPRRRGIIPETVHPRPLDSESEDSASNASRVRGGWETGLWLVGLLVIACLGALGFLQSQALWMQTNYKDQDHHGASTIWRSKNDNSEDGEPFSMSEVQAEPKSRAKPKVLLVSAIDADAEQRGEDRLRENRKAKLANYPRQQLSCPVYSGPGFDFKNVKNRTLEAAVLRPPSHSKNFESPLTPLSLHDVRLTGTSAVARAQATNLQYLEMLQPDRLVWSFRKQAGLPAVGEPYSGWEHPGNELRGHFVGHYLSAAAMAWAASGSAQLKENMEEVVRVLERCQLSAGESGYLSAFPESLFDRYENHQPVWAPYYTVQKIMAGLLDQHTWAGSKRALEMARKMGHYFKSRVERVLAKRSLQWHIDSLNMEYGGMNDVMYTLFRATNDTQFLNLAALFERPCFLGPLALEQDYLAGMHGNTHLPVIVGIQQRFELTGQDEFRDMASFFFNLVNSTRTFVTGGSTHVEIWLGAHAHGDSMRDGLEANWAGAHQESCTQYNVMKVARTLLGWTGAVKFADFLERAMHNGILGTQRGHVPGVMLYNMPLGAGMSKAGKQHWRDTGWGEPFSSFWCCYGTLVESFAKLGDSFYFQAGGGGSVVPELYIMQYTTSTLKWTAAGLELSTFVKEAAPSSRDGPDNVYTVRIEMKRIDMPRRNAGIARVNLRVPRWCLGQGARVEVNGERLDVELTSGMYVQVRWEFTTGDVLQVYFPTRLHVESLNDPNPKYASYYALLYGPLVLAGLTMESRQLTGRVQSGDSQGLGKDIWLLQGDIEAVPYKARGQLCSLRVLGLQEQNPYGGSIAHTGTGRVVVSLGGVPTSPWHPHRVGGTDEASRRSFRIVPALYQTPRDREMSEQNNDLGKIQMVSIESFDRPGCFISASVDPESDPDSGATLLTCSAVGPTALAAASFKMEEVSMGGENKHVRFWNVLKQTRVVSAACGASLGTDPQGDVCDLTLAEAHAVGQLMTTFQLNPAPASYPSVAFWAKGPTQKFLLWPLHEMVDEHYNVYWDINNE